MTGLVEPLAWDSEFFGLPIGRVGLDGATPEMLHAVEAEASDLGIACLYGALDPIAVDTAYLVQTFGFRLVEVAILLGRPDEPYPVKPTASRVRTGTVADLPLLADAVATLAPWSRFATDPRFGPEAARRMFHAWVERGARDGDVFGLLISEDDNGVTGVSTHRRDGVPRVDLMGVVTPGSGAAQALMAGFIEWAGPGPVEAGPCAARNIAVLRFLENGGFAVVSSQYLFHRWLDEPVSPDR
jgi:dTDP-4-amino-4,6-dideoxy-D-galactose acyltransferase